MENNFFKEILKEALRLKASDIHMKLNNNIYFRVEGDMLKTNIIFDNSKLKIILDSILEGHEEKLLYKKEDINKILVAENLRLRINAYLSETSPSFAIRVITNKIIKLEDLGIYNLVKNLLENLSGLVLITGRSGSGKTTTLNSILDYINNKFTYNIVTIEDPIEYKHRSIKSLINQRQVGKDTLSFDSGLISALRQDPDIIFLGETNNLETIKTALTAAETGHLVITTLHTATCTKTIDRIIDLFPSDQQNQIRTQLSLVLKSIISQKLIKERGKITAKFEYLLVDNAASNLIRENKIYQIHNTIKV